MGRNCRWISPDLGTMRTIIAGGGTGGHLFPGIAVAREIQRRSRMPKFFLSAQSRESRPGWCHRKGFRLRCLPAGSMKGVGWSARLRNLAATVKGILGAKKILKEFRPAVVIGVGGYASFPMLGAAILNGYPRIIMEQNAVPGLANRVLGRWVDFAAVTDPRTSSYFGKRARRDRQSDSAAVQIDSRQGASDSLSDSRFWRKPGSAVHQQSSKGSLPLLADWKGRLRFMHQTGEAQLEETREAYAAAGFRCGRPGILQRVSPEVCGRRSDRVARRRDDGGGNQSCGQGGDPDSVSFCGGRSPDPERASPWWRRAPRS